MSRLFAMAALLGYVAVASIVVLLGTAVVLHITWGELRPGPLVAFVGFALLLGMMIRRTSNPAILGLRGDDRHQQRAMAYASLGMTERSLASLDRHLEIHPADAQSQCLRARVLMGKKRWPEALMALDQAVELDETAASLTLRGQVLSYIGLDADAASDLERVYELDPSCATRATLAASLVSARRLQHAVAVIDEAPPEHELCVWHQRGEALRLLGRVDEASRCFERVLAELDQTHPHQQNGWLLTKVDALGHLGRNDECMALIKRIDPSQSGSIKAAHAIVALRDGRSNRAMGYVRFALKVQPSWLINVLGDPDYSALLASDGQLRELMGIALSKRRELLNEVGRPAGVF